MNVLKIALAAALALVAVPAFAFPDKPIELIVPANTGAASDVMARVLARALETTLGTSVVVINRAGGGGVEGLREFSARPADGHTIILLARSHIAQMETGDVPVDVSIFSPLTYVVNEPYIYVANSSDEQMNSGAALTAWLHDASAHAVVGGYGAKSASQIAHEAFVAGIGGTATWLPLASGSQVMESVLGRHVGVAITQLASAAQFVEAGKVSILAVSTENRLEDYPDVPTFRELGADVVQTHWRALFVHEQTDPAVREVLEQALAAAAQDEALQTYVANSGLNAEIMSPEAALAFIADDRNLIRGLLATVD